MLKRMELHFSCVLCCIHQLIAESCCFFEVHTQSFFKDKMYMDVWRDCKEPFVGLLYKEVWVIKRRDDYFFESLMLFHPKHT